MQWSFRNYIMLKSSRKKLIAIGCSYTQDRFNPIAIAHPPGYDFPVWPTLLSEKLDMDCLNLGKCGAGNEYIFSRGLDALHTEKNIGMMVIMWSEFQRMDWYKKNGMWETMHFDVGGVIRNREKWKQDIINSLNTHGLDSKKHQICRTLRFMYTLQTIAEINDIPFIQLVGTQPCSNDENYNAAKIILDSPYFDLITAIGWPIIYSIGGWCIDNWLDEVDENGNRSDSNLRISRSDSHPNKEGHEKIAEYLYKEITR